MCKCQNWERCALQPTYQLGSPSIHVEDEVFAGISDELIIMPGVKGEEAIVKCGTTKGPLKMHFYRDWSPYGYDRAVELYESGFMYVL